MVRHYSGTLTFSSSQYFSLLCDIFRPVKHVPRPVVKKSDDNPPPYRHAAPSRRPEKPVDRGVRKPANPSSKPSRDNRRDAGKGNQGKGDKEKGKKDDKSQVYYSKFFIKIKSGQLF